MNASLHQQLRALHDDGSEELKAACRRLGLEPGCALDPYEVLGLAYPASLSQVRSAWRHSAKKFHPDHTGLHDQTATRVMRILAAAYAVLVNHRAEYDELRGRRVAGDPSRSSQAESPSRSDRPGEARRAGGIWDQLGRPVDTATRVTNPNRPGSRESRPNNHHQMPHLPSWYYNPYTGTWIPFDSEIPNRPYPGFQHGPQSPVEQTEKAARTQLGIIDRISRLAHRVTMLGAHPRDIPLMLVFMAVTTVLAISLLLLIGAVLPD
jgi:hypothetical protein